VIRGLTAVDRAESSAPFEPIVRQRLVDRFVRAAACPVTLVAAPAGFGKSVAVRQYLRASGVENIRLGLRREHSTLLGFLRGLVEAIEPASPKAIRNLTSIYERAAGSERAATELSIWLDSLLRERNETVVIDDFHVAFGDRRIPELVTELIDRRKSNARWILVTRDALELPTASWLAYGVSDMPIDEVDLRLTVEEAREMARISGSSLHEPEIEKLLTLTDGWPTAYSFALRVSARTPDLGRIALGTREMIYGYLAEQVFRTLSDVDQEFLLQTALLPGIDLETLATAGFDNAASKIARLRKLTAFISADSETLFHYHDLFKDFLEHELRQRGAQAYRDAVAAAARILGAAGSYAEALPLYVLSQDWREVGAILATSGIGLFERGRIDVVEAALQALPTRYREHDASLLCLSACIQGLRGRLSEADSLFSAAREFASTPDEKADIVQKQGALRLDQSQFGGALMILESLDLANVSSDRTRVTVQATLAAALSMSGDYRRADRLIREALVSSCLNDDDQVKVTVLRYSALVALHAARFDEAKAQALTAVEIAHRLGLFALAGRVASILFLVARQNGDYAECAWALGLMKTDAESAGDADVLLLAAVNTYDLAAEAGDLSKMQVIDEQLEALQGSGDSRVAAALVEAFALRAAWSADFGTALGFLNSSETQGALPRQALRLGQAAVYAGAQGERSTAELAVKQLQELLQGLSGSPDFETSPAVKARLFLSIALILMGRSSMANNALRDLEVSGPRRSAPLRALTRAARSVYVHVETGSAHAEMASALAELRRVNFGGYARLIEALPLPATASSPRFSALTRAELRVLQSLAEGETSRQIAEQLGRSALTIDSHVKSIVRKLGCSGRREAVALARAHGLV